VQFPTLFISVRCTLKEEIRERDKINKRIAKKIIKNASKLNYTEQQIKQAKKILERAKK